jgi:integrase
MGRRRKYNSHLPRRVYLKHGAYYFTDAAGKMHHLGRTLPDMYRALAQHMGPEGTPLRLIRDVVLRYRLEILPGKGAHTQIDHARYLTMIDDVHGAMRPRDLRPVHIRQFIDKLATKRTRANRCLEVYKHLLRMAVQWGALDENPAREISKLSLAKRRRYITDAEFAAVYLQGSPMIQCAMDLAVLTGLRRADLVALTRDHLTDAGIEIETGKTGKRLIIEWSDELRAVVDRAKGLKPQVRRHLIANRLGKGYTPCGFSTQFRKVLVKVYPEKVGRFRFNDIRAKSASDDTLEAATARLGHASSATTVKHYRRAPEKVSPLRRI